MNLLRCKFVYSMVCYIMYVLLWKRLRRIGGAQRACQIKKQEANESKNRKIEKKGWCSGNQSIPRELLWCCSQIALCFNLCSNERFLYMLLRVCATRMNPCTIFSLCGSVCVFQAMFNIRLSNEL